LPWPDRRCPSWSCAAKKDGGIPNIARNDLSSLVDPIYADRSPDFRVVGSRFDGPLRTGADGATLERACGTGLSPRAGNLGYVTGVAAAGDTMMLALSQLDKTIAAILATSSPPTSTSPSSTTLPASSIRCRARSP